MFMQESFRWYGPSDQVPLSFIRQAGAKAVVSSLHHIGYGEVWSVDEIRRYQQLISDAGLTWNVVESLPVHEDIKCASGSYKKYLDNYCTSLRNLAACGIKIVTYNFMPVLDWVRTDLAYRLPDGSEALYFNCNEFAAFDRFILCRQGAEQDYDLATLSGSEQYYKSLSETERCRLERNIIDNFPGFKGVSLDDVRKMLARYSDIGRAELTANLKTFLNAVIPTAAELDMKLVIHPDDPPYPILGLPRIFSTGDDVENLLKMVDSPANGICFCAGSFSGRPDNDVVKMFKSCADRVGFIHLRSTEHLGNGNFYEANHLEGVVDMFELVKAIAAEQIRRLECGRLDWKIPFRPDHGHTMLDDLSKPPAANPGYTAIGRLKGLAELRGLEYGIMHGFYRSYLQCC